MNQVREHSVRDLNAYVRVLQHEEEAQAQARARAKAKKNGT